MNYNQKSFADGLDTITNDTAISQASYPWLINGRNRFGRIDPILKHVRLDTAPVGLKQGIIGVGNVVVIFVAGKAYYNQIGSDIWFQIPAFAMDETISRYYTLAVPASYLNFVRKLGASVNAEMVLSTDFKVAGTPAAIIVQDTINQPWLIIYDTTNQIFTARVSKNYNDWQNLSETANDREYIPIGRQMFYINGKTFIVSKDRKSLYQSITGRPLDFMMNVDINGNKAPSELIGGAATTSFNFDFDEITCVQPVSIPDSFVYATRHLVRLITMDYTNTIFGEPTYRETAKVSAGVVNQDSWLELVGIGDYAFIDFEGVISFNAVQTLKFNGRSSVFSLSLSKLLHNIRQNNPVCVLYKNFAIFNIDTIWGNIMAIYDIMRNHWASIDITEVIRIKQFAIIETVNQTLLYAITEDNHVWNMFADEEHVYPVTVMTRGHVEDETDIEHKSIYFRPFWQNFDSSDGKCGLTELVDGIFSNYVEQPMISGVGGISYPVRPPVIPSTISQVDNPTFQLKEGLMGKKINFVITWNSNASLIEYKFLSTPKQALTSQKQTTNTLSQ